MAIRIRECAIDRTVAEMDIQINWALVILTTQEVHCKTEDGRALVEANENTAIVVFARERFEILRIVVIIGYGSLVEPAIGVIAFVGRNARIVSV